MSGERCRVKSLCEGRHGRCSDPLGGSARVDTVRYKGRGHGQIEAGKLNLHVQYVMTEAFLEQYRNKKLDNHNDPVIQINNTVFSTYSTSGTVYIHF